MTISPTELDRIVKLVVQRLRQEQSPRKQTGNLSHPAIPVARETKTAVIESRLITMASLEGQLKNISCLQVPAGAIVTPAVRDSLNEQNIQLEFGNSQTTDCRNFPRKHLYLASWRTSYAGEGRRSLPILHSTQLEWCAEGDAMQTISEMVFPDEDGSSPRAVLFTEQACVAVCRLNRHAHIRAAQGNDFHDVREAIQILDNNVLVLNTNRHSPHVLWNLVGTFAKTTGKQ